MYEDLAKTLWSSVQEQVSAGPFELNAEAHRALEGIIDAGVVTLDREGATNDPQALGLAEKRLRLVVDAATNEARFGGQTVVGPKALSEAFAVFPAGFWPFT